MTGIERLHRIGPRWPRPNWLDSEHYLNLHYSHMRSLERQIGFHDGLSVNDAVPTLLIIEGDVTWPSDEHGQYPKLMVHKQLLRNDQNELQGRLYAYQACLHTPGRIHDVFRYDNVHRHEGHADDYHAHWILDGQEIVWIGLHRWPHLSDVFETLHNWWQDEGRHRHW